MSQRRFFVCLFSCLLMLCGPLPRACGQDAAVYIPSRPSDVGLKTSFSVTTFGAKGNGTTDDTAAIQAAINAASAVGGTVILPAPAVTYKITSPLTISGSNVTVQATGQASLSLPNMMQATYGQPCFYVSASGVSLQNISATYAPTTTLASSASVGATTVTVASAGTIGVGDTIILDSYPVQEQFKVYAISGTTLTVGTTGGAAAYDTNSGDGTYGQIIPSTIGASSLALPHASGAAVRVQSVLGGTLDGHGQRDAAGLVDFKTGNNCSVIDCTASCMVTGVKFRGEPSDNAANDRGNLVRGLRTDFCSFGVLAEQQSGLRITGQTTTNITSSQDGHNGAAGSAPPHAIYMTGPIGLPGYSVTGTVWLPSLTYGQYSRTLGTDGNEYQSVAGSNTGNNPVGDGGVHWTATAYNAGTTYAQYANVSYAGIQYVSIAGSNTGNQPDTDGGVHWAASGWLPSSTYAQYQQVAWNGNVYVSLASGNTGHAPTNTAYWFLTTATSTSYDADISDIVIDSNQAYNDASGIKVKFTTGGTLSNISIANADRGLDLEQWDYATLSGLSIRSMIVSNASDSAAAAVDMLDCIGSTVTNSSINLRTAAGGSIDIPAVLLRADQLFTRAPLAGNGDNFVGSVSATTNYSSGYSSNAAAFKMQGSVNSVFSHDRVTDLGAQTGWYGVGLYIYNGGTLATSQGNTGSQVINPIVSGTVKDVNIASSTVSDGTAVTTGAVLSMDQNLLPTGYTVADSGTGTLRNDKPATLALLPTSTSATPLGMTLPASFTGKSVNITDPSGNTVFTLNNASGLKSYLQSGSATNPSYLQLGTSGAAGYSASGATLGALTFGQNNQSASASPGMRAVTTEAGASGALGADLIFSTTLAGGTAQGDVLRLYGNKDVRVGVSGAALATTATSGFLHLPNMAGTPTGSVSGYTGNTPLAFDTTHKTLMANTGSANWKAVNAMTLSNGPATASTINANTLVTLSSSQNGFSYTLETPSAGLAGQSIVLVWKTTGGAYSVTLTPGSGTINGAASATFASSTTANNYRTLLLFCDGTNWYGQPLAGGIS